MTKQEFLDFCAALPGTVQDAPFSADEKSVVARHAANRKWFALVFEREGHAYANLKCEPMKADFWRAAFPGITPGWHMNHTHWNSVRLDAVPQGEIEEMARDSYRLTQR